MRAIIHAGMHKTGTSSIQDTFANIDHPEYSYLKWRSPNHSGLLAYMFYEPIEAHNSFRLSGLDRAALLQEREKILSSLTDILDAETKPNVIFSAEATTGKSQAFEDAAKRMRDFLGQWVSDFKVYAYVRSPSSYMLSAFQQLVKGAGAQNLDLEKLWPNYRLRLERLDHIFGRENVELIRFQRSEFYQGDVVRDFAYRLGIDLKPEQIIQSNEGLSLEALALLFAQRKLGAGRPTGFAASHKLNEAFIEEIEKIGRKKAVFSPEILKPVFDKNMDDLEWIEERIGTALRDIPEPGPDQITSEDDLLEIARRNARKLDHAIVSMTLDLKGNQQAKMLARFEKLDEVVKTKFENQSKRKAK